MPLAFYSSVVCVAAFAVAFVVCDVTCRIVRHCAARWGMLDDAARESHKSHSGQVPTGGGLGIVLGSVLALALLCVFDAIPFTRLAVLVPLALVIFVLGMLDDKYKLPWTWRLAVQTLVATVAVICGFRATFFVPVPFVTAALSVLWIVALTNSFNMLDNMNGLSAGVAAIAAMLLAAVAFLTGQQAELQQTELAMLWLVLLASLGGFLVHNNPFRARLFMGDGGAYFVGFLIATLTLEGRYAAYATAPQTLLVPLLILAVPLYDTASVVFIRLRERRSPFHGDKRHFSHRLVAMGLSPTAAVLTIYLTTIITGTGALLLYQLDAFGAVLVFAQVAMILSLMVILENREH